MVSPTVPKSGTPEPEPRSSHTSHIIPRFYVFQLYVFKRYRTITLLTKGLEIVSYMCMASYRDSMFTPGHVHVRSFILSAS